MIERLYSWCKRIQASFLVESKILLTYNTIAGSSDPAGVRREAADRIAILAAQHPNERKRLSYGRAARELRYHASAFDDLSSREERENEQ